jgi:hypothetical protein
MFGMGDFSVDRSRQRGPERKVLSDAAKRALAEAEARRAAADAEANALPPEVGRRKGPEPTRYGDWERKGIASDF